MKHEVINKPSTQNVLRMMFECKTFDEKNEEMGQVKAETYAISTIADEEKHEINHTYDLVSCGDTGDSFRG